MKWFPFQNGRSILAFPGHCICNNFTEMDLEAFSIYCSPSEKHMSYQYACYACYFLQIAMRMVIPMRCVNKSSSRKWVILRSSINRSSRAHAEREGFNLEGKRRCEGLLLAYLFSWSAQISWFQWLFTVIPNKHELYMKDTWVV